MHKQVEFCWGGKVKMAKGGLSSQAQQIANAGINGDSMIIHINPKEFEEIKQMFGQPNVNPKTGMPSFDITDLADGSWFDNTPAPDTSVMDAYNAANDARMPTQLGFDAAAYERGLPTDLSGYQSANVPMPVDRGGTGASLDSSYGDKIPTEAQPYTGNTGVAGRILGGGATADSSTTKSANQDSSSKDKGWLSSLTDTKNGGALNNLLKLGMLGSLLTGMMGRNKGAKPPATQNDVNFNAHLPIVANPRTYQPAANIDYSRYGMAGANQGEQQFFANNKLPSTTYAARGGLMHQRYAMGGYAAGGANPHHYVQGPGDGRADKIPAQLSNNEYVMDAETVAMLGNGSPDAGAKKLDEFRENIRKQKGPALAQGRISPDAKEPHQYLRGGLTHGGY